MKINENSILFVGIIGMVVIAIVAIFTIKNGALALATGVIGVIGGFLYHPVKSQLTSSPVDPNSTAAAAEPTTITQDPTTDEVSQIQTPVVINPTDVINQAIVTVQNNPTLLQDIVSIVGVVSGDQNLLGQVQTVLNNSNGDMNLITNGIAAVKNLIPNANAAPIGA